MSKIVGGESTSVISSSVTSFGDTSGFGIGSGTGTGTGNGTGSNTSASSGTDTGTCSDKALDLNSEKLLTTSLRFK